MNSDHTAALILVSVTKGEPAMSRFDLVRNIVTRLEAGGISQTTIRNVLLEEPKNEDVRQLQVVR